MKQSTAFVLLIVIVFLIAPIPYLGKFFVLILGGLAITMALQFAGTQQSTVGKVKQ